LLAELGNPETHFATIHVGGTNGKGSVAVLVAEALRVAGHRVGLYTSPHLVDVRERMLVDGRPIPVEAFVEWTRRLAPVLDAAGASFFEATTAIAFADFAARGVDVAVVEVGLGGRLDATNVLTPLVSTVTHVALEHTEYLGTTLESIALEKAGIAKQGVPFVVGEPDPALRDLMLQHARSVGAWPIVVAPDERYTGPLALRGPHQRRNAAIAAHVAGVLPDAWRPPMEAVVAGFARARLPGRFDRQGVWLFDVAHNPDGLSALLAALAADPPRRPLHAVVCILRDKDWRGMLARLAGVVDGLWLTHAPSAPPDRVWDLDAAGGLLGRAAVVEPDLAKALVAARQGAATVLVTGSFHTVGDAMARLPGFEPLG